MHNSRLVFLCLATVLCLAVGACGTDSCKHRVAVSTSGYAATLGQPISRVETSDSVLALTFDACHTRRPHGYDSVIVRILRQTGTHATFFLCGSWMEHYPEVTVSLARDTLFELANHTYYHPIPGLVGLSPESVSVEVRRTQEVMESLAGVRAVQIRPPAGEYDSIVLRVMATESLNVVLWDVSSGDADKTCSAEHMKAWVLQQVRPGSIVLFHMNTRGWHTAEALPALIAGLRGRGYKLCTVAEILTHDARAKSR